MITIRFKFNRGEGLRFISHLDMQRLFHRAFRRAEIPLAFSNGFNPHPKLAFAGAIPLGLICDEEYGDVGLNEAMTPEAFTQALNAALPLGMEVKDAWVLPVGTPSLSACLTSVEYRLWIKKTEEGRTVEAITSALTDFMAQETIIIKKRTKRKRIKDLDIRPFLRSFELLGEGEDGVEFSLKMRYIDQQCVKPLLVMKALEDAAQLGLQVDERMVLRKIKQSIAG